MDLFTPISRDRRQSIAVSKWLKTNGHATVVGATGFGKTHVAIKAITVVRKKYPNLKVLVLVPTTALKSQWEAKLAQFNLSTNTSVQVMMGASQREASCDLLIIDEAHKVNAEIISNVFKLVKFKLILGLTATFERLDGRHEILAQYAPVCDTITLQEALLNGWISPYKDYVVILDVADIDTYKQLNAQFQEHLSFFDWNFDLAMKLTGPTGFQKRKEYTSSICKNQQEWGNIFKQVTYHLTGLMRTLQQRKKFIANHPEKVRIANKIINARPDKKIITFCPSVKVAESFGYGYVFTGKEGKKKNRITLQEFSGIPSGVMHSIKLAEEGLDLPDLSVGIMLGVNSSKTKQVQTLGRVVRTSPGKEAEFFTIVINDTAEVEWMRKSRSDDNFIILDEEGLDHVLAGEPYEPYKRKLPKLNFRF